MRSLQFLFVILSAFVTLYKVVTCQDICRAHGIREVSGCTSGFTSILHIEVVEQQTELSKHDGRQVLIPAMNFNCSGSLTKWIFSAVWQGNLQAFTELQIWRKNGTVSNVYSKVGATTIQVTSENFSEITEFRVDPPLTFQAGDILGYFQPNENIAQLNLYLEDSARIVTFRNNVGENQTVPLRRSFDFDAPPLMGEDYPLIGAETDPPNCGCGLVTCERMKTLLALDRDSFGIKNIFPQEQGIFPNIQFICTGRVVKWIIGASYAEFLSGVEYFSELQIWRPTSNTTFQKLNGTITTVSTEVPSGIYEFVVEPPLPVQPGDILGIFQPPLLDSRLLVDYDSGENAKMFYLPLMNSIVQPAHTSVDVNVGGWQTGTVLPLVSVEIALDELTTMAIPNLVTTPIQATTIMPLTPTTAPNPAKTSTETTADTTATSPGMNADTTPVQTTSPPVVVDSTDTSSTQGVMFYIGLGVVGILLALIAVLIVILLFVLFYPKKRGYKQKMVQIPTPEPGSSAEYVLATDVIDAASSSEPPSPNNTDDTFDDPIYNTPIQQSCDTGNQCYQRAPKDEAITAYAVANVHCNSTTALMNTHA